MSVLALPDEKDLPNFGWMTPWLCRGGHPNPAGFRWLGDHGIKAIVNLRDDDDTERLLGASCGFIPVHVPVADGTAPSDEQAVQWLALCARVECRPLFVHCRGGKGRTSTFCMLVRLAQGWTLDDAMREAIERFEFDPAADPDQVAFLMRWCSRLAGTRQPIYD